MKKLIIFTNSFRYEFHKFLILLEIILVLLIIKFLGEYKILSHKDDFLHFKLSNENMLNFNRPILPYYFQYTILPSIKEQFIFLILKFLNDKLRNHPFSFQINLFSNY